MSIIEILQESVDIANELYDYFNPEQEMTPEIKALFIRLDNINKQYKEKFL